MSEKLKLANGQEFDLIPMGIVPDDAKKVRYFKFTSSLTYEELKTIFSNSANLATIDYIGEDGLVAKTYQDCVKMLVISFVPNFKVDDNTTADIYIVTISTDEVIKEIASLNSQIDDLSNTIVMMTMM